MELEEFREEFLQDVNYSAEVNISDVYTEFIRKATSIMMDVEEIEDFTECYFETTGKQNKKVMIDGYYFDSVDKSCLIFISDYSNDEELTTLTNAQIDVLYGRMRAFVDNSISGYIENNCEISQQGYGFAQLLRETFNEITKFRFYILTDKILSDRVKRIKKSDIENKKTELNVWDINRFFDIERSNMEKTDIVIDFNEKYGRGINCIKINNAANEEYEPYLAVIPGDILADMYLDYGARLLEGNVRSFLSVKGKVNKNIRETIIKWPEMFFAYNNGIAATATEVETEELDGITVISKIKDLQIINGGQTTASIANVVINKEASVENVNVAMKLSVVNKEKAKEIIPKISRSANSQNKVDEADFFSNHDYHVRMEEYSRKIYAPAVNGNQFQTIWFYERAKGQYTQEQMKLTPAERKKYQLKNPKNQLIKKVEWAKYINSYEGKPHIVSKGAQFNMREFATNIEKEWEKDNAIYNEVYFRNVISLAILFKETEKIVSDQDWYKAIKAYRANIVTYTISILSYIVKKQYPDKKINLRLIWNKQSLYPELRQQIIVTTEEVYEFINREDRTTLNVTEWCKKETCWKRAMEYDWTINDSFIDSLSDANDEKEELKEGKKNRKMTNDLNLEMEVVNKGANYWNEVLAWGKERRLLNEIEISLLEIPAKMEMTGRTPTTFQAKKIIEIEEKIRKEGMNI